MQEGDKVFNPVCLDCANDAIIYRQEAGGSGQYEPYLDLAEEPFVSNPAGYLQGYGDLSIGDQLIALMPVTTTHNYDLFHTSALPIESGVEAYEVTTSGVQTLTVSSDNPLLLFNLVVSLEWDARQDSTYIEQLKRDLHRTSEILYDMTNGQAALGRVHVYHDRGYWSEANIIISADNNIRPSAILGGGVDSPMHDVDKNGALIEKCLHSWANSDATPMEIAFGNPDGTIGEDWPRTLAHELGHYLFFHPDNYLGVNNNLLQNYRLSRQYHERSLPL